MLQAKIEEQKQLLLQDLCARLPYGVKVKENYHTEICILNGVDLGNNTIIMESTTTIFKGISLLSGNGKIKVKPYLRPMSSMTEEDKKDFRRFQLDCYNITYDWLNKNHFDYRGLIPMGLAIAVTKENNPYKDFKTPKQDLL